MYQKIIDAVSKAGSIAIFAHTSPDGDALGSASALYIALTKAGKDCGLFCDEPVPRKYQAFPFPFALKPSKKYDLAVAVDCADLARLGQNAKAFSSHKNTVNIDHHYTNERFAAINVVEDKSSTAEIVFSLLKELGAEIDAQTAEALFVGLTADTGSFGHANINADSFLAAAELVKLGADAPKAAYEVFKKSPLNRTKLLGKTLSRMRSYLDGKVTLIYTLGTDFAEFGLDKAETEAFVDYAINAEGTLVGVALCQHSENVYKAGLRSRGAVDVSKVAAHFGGGGHKQAAGCMVSGLFEDAIEKLLRQIGFELGE